MKRKIIKISLVGLGIAALVLGNIFINNNSNKTLIDTTYRFDHAILKLPDGTIVNGEVQTWADFADGDQIQVKINGETYLVHSSNIALIQKKDR